ncbi:hypothetical protein TPB0596_03070 [Tsukamurella pulmonis]|uniref:MSCRAMM family adhesin SdrC n=1 Tax=Tsukamurella pulmonis TaxID=47312 RepID=UPI001EDD438E|nr:MSCRAMM family adhesin SdrC [Tsukamurella pulmonis]BDD80544.1 hypothetical protein TPB0596_03070 [Tsukamurella pulmonis]
MIDRPDTPHADVLLEGIWEDEVTPDDLASRALSAAQASSYAFRVASEGTTATAQLGEVDVAEFLESETGKWAQSFIGIVRVGESLVHVSAALGELARSLQQVNLEQSEIVYQVEAEIEAAELQSAQTGVDSAERIAELIAHARARAAEVAEKMATPESVSAKKKPAAGLVSGFMAFGRVPGNSAEATERNGRVARNGHARSGYAIRNTRAAQNGHDHATVNGHDDAATAVNGHDEAHAVPDDTVNGHASVNGHEAAGAETAARPEDAAAAAEDAFANSVDEAPMDLVFMGFGRTPSGAVLHAESADPDDVPASVPAPEADEADDAGIDDADAAEPAAGAAEGEPVEARETPDVESGTAVRTDASPSIAVEPPAPVLSEGFLGLGRAPSHTGPNGETGVPALPQPLEQGFTFGRVPGAAARAPHEANSGPFPVAAATGFLPIAAESTAAGASFGEEAGEPLAVGGGTEHPEPSRIDAAAAHRDDTANDDVLSFGRVPGGARRGSGAVPTVPGVGAAAAESLSDEPIGTAASVGDVAEVDVSEDLGIDDVALDEDELASVDFADDALDADDEPDTEIDGAGVLDAVEDDAEAVGEPMNDEIAAESDDEHDVLDSSGDDSAVAGAEGEDIVEEDVDAPEPDSGEIVEVESEEAGADPDEADETDQPASADGSDGDADEAAAVESDETGEPVPDGDADEATAVESDETGEPARDDDADEAPAAESEAPDADADETDGAQTVSDEDADDDVLEGPVEPVEEADRHEDAADDAAPGEAAADPVDVPAEDAAPAPDAAAAGVPAAPAAGKVPAAAVPVKKAGPKAVKFSELIKATRPSASGPAQVSAATAPAPGPAESTTPAEPTVPAAAAAPSEPEPAPEPTVEVPARPAPVLATGPVILGRAEPLVLPRRSSPEVQHVHDAVASILGSLRGGPHGPESGLHWAAALLVKDAETVMAVTTSDAGWLPLGVVIPAGVRVLWNAPDGYRWASVDDPVRQLVEYARRNGYTLSAVATTHPSRAYASVVGEENLVGVRRAGAVLPGGRNRLEATVSPVRLQHIRSLDPEQAQRQMRALIRDLETQPIAPEHAIGIEAARIDARCFLDERAAVPPAVLQQLHSDEQALGDALRLDRTPASPADLEAPAPAAVMLRDRLLERAILVATLASAYRDIESAVYAWTFARFLSSQDQD